VDADALRFMGAVGEYALPECEAASRNSPACSRAAEVGLLTHLGETWFAIHPALPWFLRQLFARTMTGRQGARRPGRAPRLGRGYRPVGDHYHNTFAVGNQDVIALLELERITCSTPAAWRAGTNGGKRSSPALQGLRALYEHQGRPAEWARLAEEIRPDFCTEERDPFRAVKTIRCGHRYLVPSRVRVRARPRQSRCAAG